ncbi:MAG: hypothetical protein JSS82_04110 [Bacteroidetes bacterium]|nr:hypothetical protein [Bacteroidota bacterium]
MSTFKQGQGYIIDWYQDDYRGSSWMNLGAYGASDSTLFYPFLDFDTEHAYYIQLYVPQNIWRSVLLDGNKSYTLWHAVDAKKQIDSSSIWQQLSDNERFKEIQFHKYYWCVCRSKDSAGSVIESKPALYATKSATELGIFGGIFATFSSSKTLTNIDDTFWAKSDSIYYAMVKVE